jgi:PPK2 family polyphosphate:nucleotide phosphotransferase
MAAKDTAKRWRIRPRQRLDLAKVDTGSRAGAPGGKDATNKASEKLREELIDLQARLWGESRQSLLIVLQAMDAGGKDGTIRSVFSGVNPQGVRVAGFKVPTDEELAHDFLWRVHARTPRHGEVAIFNRSHYEDVLVVRVHELVPKPVWKARYAEIVAFEDTLTQAHTRVVKLFLHISKEEQAQRLQERLDDPAKRFKFRKADLDERKLWDDYQAAYRDAIVKTTTPDAPWYVIPADRNWYRDWAVLTVLVETLRDMDPQYPDPEVALAGVVIE